MEEDPCPCINIQTLEQYCEMMVQLPRQVTSLKQAERKEGRKKERK